MIGALLWGLLAIARAGDPAPAAPGERLAWEIHYLGLHVGDAEAQVVAGPDGGLRLQCSASSSTWAGRIYAIDDRIESWWRPETGSSRYLTIFREGRFHQDQDMDLAAEPIVVARKQRYDEGWRSWTDTYPGASGPLEDPVSAFYRLRLLPLEPGGAYGFSVFTGREIIEMQVAVEAIEEIPGPDGPVEALRTRLSSPGYDRGEIEVWLTRDAARLPVRVVWRSRGIGSVRADLIAAPEDVVEPGDP